MLSKILSLILIYIIKAYKLFISPLLGNRCRFHPTCSQYALDAINTYGLIKGIRLSLQRILKCHPFGSHGYDPIPTEKK